MKTLEEMRVTNPKTLAETTVKTEIDNVTVVLTEHPDRYKITVRGDNEHVRVALDETPGLNWRTKPLLDKHTTYSDALQLYSRIVSRVTELTLSEL